MGETITSEKELIVKLKNHGVWKLKLLNFIINVLCKINLPYIKKSKTDLHIIVILKVV